MTLNRVSGIVKLLTGLSGALAAACFLALGSWVAVPFGVAAGLALSQGVVQVVTGWSDDEV